MPSRLGRYAVRRRIGSGGFATVWLAYDDQLDSPVAVKVLADNWTEDSHVRKRFLEEGRYLRRVESPHVVSVYDAGELEDGRPYLVMTYADQGTLADRLEVAGLGVGQALEVVRQVGAGLQALHDNAILRRDVKPANVLFRTVETPPGRSAGTTTTGSKVRVMLGDLGLGKALDVSSRLTMVGGTPSFVAPEQAQGESPDARADQYSLAALSYLLLAGRTAYSHASLAAAAQPGPPPPLPAVRGLPAAAGVVLHRGLARDRDDRYPDVGAFVDALVASLGATLPGSPRPWLPVDPQLTRPGARPTPQDPSQALPEPTPPPRRRGLRSVAAVGVLALLVGAGAGYLASRAGRGDVSLSDESGSLSVTVPADWDRVVFRGGWRPPNGDADFPALSVGMDDGWTRAGSTSSGVFVALLPGSAIPGQLPQHPECSTLAPAVADTLQGHASMTVVHSDCPGGVTVERVVQVSADQLLWVQVRSANRASVNEVLDHVEIHGMS